MLRTNLPIFLASKSPRRKKLLEQINLSFEIVHSEIDETIYDNELPEQAVMRLAKEKAESCIDKCKGIVISADTIVVVDNKVLGKPSDEKEAFEMLKILSGNNHHVFTGYSVLNTANNYEIVDYEKTEVTFRVLDDDEIIDYIKTGSPLDKAGAYGIQDDFGAVFITKIVGDYYNVVGLPLSKVYSSLKKVL